ncbi:cell wall hydrolase [Sphingomonas sp. QA11]|uniref:cell wall hydrolase n=1 Tax=Sphingomonas sp. QA11 TaxID=2950605 RepID=UPI00234926CE|nr:cell wall hydrolase [Sphingomonas sp. QA11]WCM28038.1 cell wall hydrolase [Sphingomonas sp. QA11]
MECLALTIAYEAGYESKEGQQAVAEVVLNRLRSPSFPKTICDVVFAGSTKRTGCQFTFTCDGSLHRKLPERVMSTARAVAEDAIDGRMPSRVPRATHYHADYVSPYWAPRLVRVTKIGAHIFYRSTGESETGSLGAFPIADLSGSVGAVANSARGQANPETTPPVFAPWGLAPPATTGPNSASQQGIGRK